MSTDTFGDSRFAAGFEVSLGYRMHAMDMPIDKEADGRFDVLVMNVGGKMGDAGCGLGVRDIQAPVPNWIDVATLAEWRTDIETASSVKVYYLNCNCVYETIFEAPKDVEEGFVGFFTETTGTDNVYAVQGGRLWGPFEFEVEAMGWYDKYTSQPHSEE